MSDDLRLKVSSWCRRVQCLVSSIEHIKERVRARAPEPEMREGATMADMREAQSRRAEVRTGEARRPPAPRHCLRPLHYPLRLVARRPRRPDIPPAPRANPWGPEPRPHARPVYFIRRTAAPALTKRPDITRSLIIYATYYGVKAKSAVDRKRPKRYHADAPRCSARRYDKNRLVTRGLEHRGVTDERQRERVSESRQE